MKVAPHVAQNASRRKSAVPDSVAKIERYAISPQDVSQYDDLCRLVKKLDTITG